MQKPIVSKMDEKFLQCGTEFSDRFIFSYYFIPRRITFADEFETPVLTFNQKGRLGVFHYQLGQPKFEELLSDLGLPQLLDKNSISLPPAVAIPEPEVISLMKSDRKQKIKKFSKQDVVTSVSPTQKAEEIDSFMNALQSEVGYLFFDRTRIRPKGFAIGEHVYALSLAPGEEVVLEQKTFSKKSVTFEEQTEKEEQFDLELSSTLTNEIQEGFERQHSLTDSSGLQVGGQLGAQIEVVNVGASASYSRNITEANNATRTRSVKESQAASSKTASKYRTMHKVTFKISTEEGFESTSKRVLRNPNRYTPVDLHYFKILRVLEMSQERYGARLCWAPFIKDPAIEFLTRIKDGKKEIIERAVKSVQLEPEPPRPAEKTVPRITKLERKTVDKWNLDGSTDSRFNIEIPFPEENYIWDFDVEKVKRSIRVDTAMKRTCFVEADGDPYPDSGKIIVPVHVVTPSRPAWAYRVAATVGAVIAFALPLIPVIGIAGAWAAALVGLKIAAEDKDALNEWSPLDVIVEADFDPDPATHPQLQSLQTELKEWRTKMDTWETNKDTLLKGARDKGVQAADAWEQEMLKKLNPLAEMMNRVIQHYFPAAIRDIDGDQVTEGWEIDFWQKLFDWDAASYVLYPSWWSDSSMREPTKEPADFMNASWARLYLPIKIEKIDGVSLERLALRWIFDKVTGLKSVDQTKENVFAAVEKELDTYRKNHFGDVQETKIVETKECPEFKEEFLCLARWTELMPTDGTHIEVVQSMTNAADQFSKKEVDDANRIRHSMIENQEQEIELKKRAIGKMTTAAKINVNISTEGGSSGG
jgi:hypothetical protein